MKKQFLINLDPNKPLEIIYKGQLKKLEVDAVIVDTDDEKFLLNFENTGNFLRIQERSTTNNLRDTTNPLIIKKFLRNSVKPTHIVMWDLPEAETSDKVVDDVIDKFQQRSNVGISKYSTTLHQNNKDNFLIHLQEELMDATLYIQKLLSNTKEFLSADSKTAIYNNIQYNVGDLITNGKTQVLTKLEVIDSIIYANDEPLSTFSHVK